MRMQEELTAKMHSEFTVSEEVAKKHTALVAIQVMREDGFTLEEVADLYDLEPAFIEQHIAEYDRDNVEEEEEDEED